MTVIERVAYLKGLFEGLEINTDKKEGKLLEGMLFALEDLSQTVTDLQQQNQELIDELDDVYEELSAIAEDFLSEEENELDIPSSLYQVICPTCGEQIFLDEEALHAGSIVCHACGEELEFDLSELESDSSM